MGCFGKNRKKRNAFLSNLQNRIALRNKKLDILKNMDIFVLDNSLRETTVASVRAHTVESKRAIFQEIKKCGFKNFLIESFVEEARIGEHFLEELIANKEDLSGAFAFSDMWDRIVDGMPEPDISIGLQKCKKFGIKNVMLEFDLMYSYQIKYLKIKGGEWGWRWEKACNAGGILLFEANTIQTFVSYCCHTTNFCVVLWIHTIQYITGLIS